MPGDARSSPGSSLGPADRAISPVNMANIMWYLRPVIYGQPGLAG